MKIYTINETGKQAIKDFLMANLKDGPWSESYDDHLKSESGKYYNCTPVFSDAENAASPMQMGEDCLIELGVLDTANRIPVTLQLDESMFDIEEFEDDE
ncbi:MAG: hypothetical protein Q8L20_10875 [Gammaproteobacteria bacterium]|nr:hypothetical protein [Gammaproteobacteria bacterium]